MEGVLITFFVCVALPLTAIWLVTRYKQNKNKAIFDVIMAALEKNPDVDIEQLMNEISTKRKKGPEEKQSFRISAGCILIALGIGLTALKFLVYFNWIIPGVISLSLGIGFIAAFLFNRKK